MPVTRTELNIRSIWNGTLVGILLKNDSIVNGKFRGKTHKIIAIHGWLDNLNSMLPLAERLVNRHPNYEIYLYDRSGHGLSSHLPKGFDYSSGQNLQDLRDIIQTLGWHKEKFSIIGHSYGAILGTIYSASFPDDVICFVALDGILRQQIESQLFWRSMGSRIDSKLEDFHRPPKVYKDELTFEKAAELTMNTRAGITLEASKLLVERSVRQDKDNKLHFTRDPYLKMLSLVPYTSEMVENSISSIKASVLFIGATQIEWPKPHKSINLLRQYNPNFEEVWIDGPHHLHMTHVDIVADRIEEYFNKYLEQSLPSVIENSKL